MQLQVCPGVNEVGQIDKGVQAQAIVPVIGQVCHEDADLWETKGITPRVLASLDGSAAPGNVNAICILLLGQRALDHTHTALTTPIDGILLLRSVLPWGWETLTAPECAFTAQDTAKTMPTAAL